MATDIDSGNVTFISSRSPDDLAREFFAALRRWLPKPVDVAVDSRAQLVLARMPGGPAPCGSPGSHQEKGS